MLTSRRILSLAMSASIVGAFVVAWAITQWWWLNQPMSPELRAIRAETVQRAAQAIAAGRSMDEVEVDMGIDLRPNPGPEAGPPTGPPPTSGLFVALPLDDHWTLREGEAPVVWERLGPEREVAAWAGDRWIVLHNDAVPPGVGLLGLFLLASAPLLIAAVSLTGRAISPVEAAELALQRISVGDLGQLLDEDAGPPELRRMARVVNALTRETARLVQRERQRMAGLSHEMRTPLTRARLELELVRRAGADSERISRVEGELEQLDELVDELLQLARLESRRRPLRAETIDLRGFAEALLDDEEEQGVQVDGAGTAHADPRLLRRAVANLLRNSRQHAPGAQRAIRVGPGFIEVADDGPGVSEAERARLFDVFWRGPGRETPGHGLGLAIVQEIVRAHGGSLTLHTDGGFRVRLQLPAAEVSSCG